MRRTSSVCTRTVQIFFYFSGHGASHSGDSQLLVGSDGKCVSFLKVFHQLVTCNPQLKRASIVAVLDCCRNALQGDSGSQGEHHNTQNTPVRPSSIVYACRCHYWILLLLQSRTGAVHRRVPATLCMAVIHCSEKSLLATSPVQPPRCMLHRSTKCRTTACTTFTSTQRAVVARQTTQWARSSRAAPQQLRDCCPS